MKVFAPELDSVAIADFVHGGVKFVVGQPFPHRELKLNPLEMRGLWLAHLIEFVVPVATILVAAPVAAQPKPQQQPNQRR